MAKYVVADPAGIKHVIDGPDGASPQDVIAQAQKVIPYKPFPQGQQPQQQTNPMPQPQAQRPPQQGLGQMDPQDMIKAFARIDPQGAQKIIEQMMQKQMGGGPTMNPLQQAQADYYKARTGALQQGKQGSADPAAYVDDAGDVSISPKEGYKPVTKAQLPYVGVSASTKARNKAMSGRGEAMERGIDARQIDKLAQSVGVTQAQRNLLQQNNMRANRAIELASKPMTWQEFGAVTTDAAAIMQGGSPQVQQLHEMSYPSWKQDLARAQTYMTSTPTANVPDEFKKRIIGMIQGVQQVDNRYLTKNSEFMQKMLAPTIRGGIGQFKSPIQDMTNTITESGSTAKPYSDPQKEARYQAWKKSQGL